MKKLINNIDNPDSFPRTKLKWQGKEVKVECVMLKVFPVEDKPLWWSNFEVDEYRANCPSGNYALIESLKVWYRDSEPFHIANHFGIGIRKLRKGGWPNHNHFSYRGNFEEVIGGSTYHPTINFTLRLYEEHEARRRDWQRKNFPDEFNRYEGLRKLATGKF
ncbi:hypothetical protein FGF1_03690 [Flavobacteriaceae bacterium GF1]